MKRLWLSAVIPSVILTLPAVEEGGGATLAGEDEIVVSATRMGSPRFYQPYALTTVTEEDIDSSLARTTVDALHARPGVAIQRTAANQASPFIRGLTGEQTLLLFDGIRYSHAMMRPGPNQYAAMMPEPALSGVDILLGSSSAVTGSDGLTGALDFRLAEAGRGIEEPLSVWGEGRYGSADGARVAGGADGMFGELSYSIEAGMQRYGDIRGGKDTARRLRQNDLTGLWDLSWADLGLDGDLMETLGLYGKPINYTGIQPHFRRLSPNPATRDIPNTGYDQWNAGARVAWHGPADQHVELAAGVVRQQDAPRPDGYLANSGRSDRISRYFPQQNFSYLHGTHTWRPNAEVIQRTRVRGWYHLHDEDQIRERTRSGGTVYRRQEKYDQIRAVGGEAELVVAPFADNLLTLGVTGMQEQTDNAYYEVRSTGGTADPYQALPHDPSTWQLKTSVPDDSRYDTYAAFIQDEWLLFDRLTLAGSLRYTSVEWESDIWGRQGYENYTLYGYLESVLSASQEPILNRMDGPGTVSSDADNISWSGRVSYAVTDELVLYTGYGRSFRAPNLNNLFGRTDRGSSGNIQTGNPFMAPEISYTLDVGGRYRSGEDEILASVFHTRVEDLIQPTTVDADLDLVPDYEQLTNAEDAELWGGEGSWDYGLPLRPWIGDDRRVAVVGSVNYVRATVNVPQADGSVQRAYISRSNRVFGQGGIRYEDLGGRRWLLVQTRWSDRYDKTEPFDAADARMSFPGVGTATGEIPGYMLLDVKGGWQSQNEKLSVICGVENLLDKSYRVPGSGLDGPGLNLTAQLEARF